MTPEAKFIKDIWYVLRRLKERSLYTKSGELIEYAINFSGYRNPQAPSETDEVSILEKLQEWKAIGIKNVEQLGSEYLPEDNLFYIELKHPKFDEFHALFKNGLSLNIEPEKLLKMAEEWAHPIRTDDRMSFETWEIIKGKKKPKVQAPSSGEGLSAADEKKLCVLEKVKWEWDLAPADYEENGVRAVLITEIPEERYDKWIRDCGLEDEQRLMGILATLQQKGLIDSFHKTANFV